MRLGDVGPAARCWPPTATGPGDVLRHDSIVGTTFLGARSSATTGDGVLTEVEGIAYRTGEHRFILDPRDPLGTGLRPAMSLPFLAAATSPSA